MIFLIAIFLLIWLSFFKDRDLGSFVINAQIVSWLIIIFTDEPGLFRSLAGLTVVLTGAVCLFLIFNLLLHKSVKGFLE